MFATNPKSLEFTKCTLTSIMALLDEMLSYSTNAKPRMKVGNPSSKDTRRKFFS